MAAISERHYGMILVIVSAVLWSTAGLFVRMADLDAWTVLGWRSLFSAMFLGLMALIGTGRHPWRAVLGLGTPGLLSVPLSIVATISYVFALKLTSVANVMTVYATLPFVATGIAYLWIGERVTARVLIASGVSLVGIVIIAGAATAPGDIAGIMAAFLMTLGFGTQLVQTKRHPRLDMTLVNAIASALCALICWPMMASGIPTAAQLVTLAAFGILTTGIAYVLVLTGSRYVTSGEAAFLSLLDVVLGPLWVWLFFAERPGQAVLTGGSIVLAAVVWYLAKGLKTPDTPDPLRA